MAKYISIQQALIMQGDSQSCVMIVFCFNMCSSIQIYTRPASVNSDWQHVYPVDKGQVVT